MFRPLLLPCFALLLCAAPAPALALGTEIWINCRNGEFDCLKNRASQGLLDELVSTYEDLGHTPIVDTGIDSVVGDGNFRLLIVIAPTNAFDTPTRNLIIPGFLSQGGRLVVLADTEEELPDANENVRELLSSIPNNPIELGTDDLNLGCNNEVTGGGIQPDALTAGLDSWHFARVNSVTGGTPLLNYTASDGSGTKTLASVWRPTSGGEVVVFGDIEGFVMNCEAAESVAFAEDNRPLWENLYLDQGAGESTDDDGDTYDATIDCDDGDASVHPGAFEACNGRDDNCDGTVDEGCGDDDDDSTPAGDDDTTPTGDDDTSGSFGDDDSDPTVDRDSWGGCSCGGEEAVLLVLLPFGPWLRRRRVRGVER